MQERACQIEDNQEKMSALQAESSRLKSTLEKQEDEYSGSDIVRREKDLKRQLADLDARIEGIRDAIRTAFTQVTSYGKRWSAELKRAEEAGFSPSGNYRDMIRRMAELTEDQIWEFPFGEAASRLDALRRELEEYRAELKKRNEQLKESRRALEADI